MYLPPAWFSSPRPALPVIMLIQGVPGTPEDWTRAGGADVAANRFAAQHGGVAPVIVMPDPNGGFFRDTQCVDGNNGRAEAYLTEDIPAWLIRTFGVSPDATRWAVGGASSGGYCAMMLSLRHPERFSVALVFSGTTHMTYTGGHPERLFRGTRKTVAQYDVLRLLASAPSLPRAVLLSIGSKDPYVREARATENLARRRGILLRSEVIPGKRHNWPLWRASFARNLDWTAHQLGQPDR